MFFCFCLQDESESESDEESEEEQVDTEDKREKVINRITKRRNLHEKNRSTNKLRAPVVCVLGKFNLYSRLDFHFRLQCDCLNFISAENLREWNMDSDVWPNTVFKVLTGVFRFPDKNDTMKY